MISAGWAIRTGARCPTARKSSQFTYAERVGRWRCGVLRISNIICQKRFIAARVLIAVGCSPASWPRRSPAAHPAAARSVIACRLSHSRAQSLRPHCYIGYSHCTPATGAPDAENPSRNTKTPAGIIIPRVSLRSRTANQIGLTQLAC